MGHICIFLWTHKILKAFSFRGASYPEHPLGALPPGLTLGASPQTLVRGLLFALAMGSKLSAVLN